MADQKKPFVVIEVDGERQTYVEPGSEPIRETIPVPPPTAVEIATRLATLKADRAALVEQRRDAAIAGGFTFGPGRFQSDPASVRNIEGYVVSALGAELRSEEWSRRYRLEDNSEAVIDGPTMIDIGRAWERHKEDCYVHSWTLKAAIVAAATADALEAINVDAGWPGSTGA